MDGWTKKGDILKCAACGHTVCEFNPETKPADPLKSEAANRLKSLFGADDFVEKPTLKTDGSETRFCKDCAFLIPHPFILRCGKLEKEVQPMDDCPHYQRRKS